MNFKNSTSVFGLVTCRPLCLEYVASKLISSMLNFSLKNSTVKAFWSNVILLHNSVGTELNSFNPFSKIVFKSFSASTDNLALLSTSLPSTLFVNCFNCFNLIFLNDSFKTSTLLLSKNFSPHPSILILKFVNEPLYLSSATMLVKSNLSNSLFKNSVYFVNLICISFNVNTGTFLSIKPLR